MPCDVKRKASEIGLATCTPYSKKQCKRMVGSAENLAKMFLNKLHRKTSKQIKLTKKRPNYYLNCRLDFLNDNTGIDINNGSTVQENKIACRHLAIAYLFKLFDVSEKKHLPFSSGQLSEAACEIDIKQTVGKITEGYYNILVAQSSVCYFIANDCFGGWLKSQFEILKHQPVNQAFLEQSFLLEVPEHSMALVLTRKIKYDQIYYVLALYDPNTSTNHVRIQRCHPNNFSQFSLKDFFSPKYYKCYFENSEDEFSLLHKVPQGEEAQNLFAPEKLLAAASECPESMPRQLQSFLGANLNALNADFFKDLFFYRLINLSLYRLFFSKALFEWNQGSLHPDDFSVNSVFHYADPECVLSWLELELKQYPTKSQLANACAELQLLQTMLLPAIEGAFLVLKVCYVLEKPQCDLHKKLFKTKAKLETLLKSPLHNASGNCHLPKML